MKLNAKVHKMNSEDVQNKIVYKLKFRPVQDSSAWIIKPYAVILMWLIRDLMTSIKNKFENIRDIDSVSGVKISEEMRQIKFADEKLKFFVSSDMSSAYSNIFKDQVFKAIVLITNFLGINDWEERYSTEIGRINSQ